MEAISEQITQWSVSPTDPPHTSVSSKPTSLLSGTKFQLILVVVRQMNHVVVFHKAAPATT